MDTALSPRESGEFISQRCTRVHIDIDQIENAANVLLQRMLEVEYSEKTWKTHDLHPKEMTENTINWIFVVDCLNFSFWAKRDEEPFMVEFKGKLFSDYEALCAVVNRALYVS